MYQFGLAYLKLYFKPPPMNKLINILQNRMLNEEVLNSLKKMAVTIFSVKSPVLNPEKLKVEIFNLRSISQSYLNKKINCVK